MEQIDSTPDMKRLESVPGHACAAEEIIPSGGSAHSQNQRCTEEVRTESEVHLCNRITHGSEMFPGLKEKRFEVSIEGDN